MKRITFLFMCLLFVSASWAQNIQVSGVVTDASDGQPLPGAVVVVKGTKTTAITDVNGHFTITAPADGLLEISSMNMTTQVVSVQGRATINVVLEAARVELEEVIVTAMGIQRTDRSVGYAVSKVDPNEATQKAEPDLLRALNGKIPGVQVNASSAVAGSATKVTIRGSSSFTGNNDPLYVVDGTPYSDVAVTTGSRLTSAGAYGSGISTLDPNDIESMNVLKGAAAAALYGSRAANGVILITTKSGSKKARPSQKKFEITLTASYSIENVASLPDYQNTYGAGTNFTYSNANGSWGAPFSERETIPIYSGYQAAYPTLPNEIAYQAYPNNVKDLFRTGGIYDISANILSFNDKGNFNVTVSRTKQDGAIPNQDFERASFSVGGNQKLDNGFRVGGTVSYSRTIQNGPYFGAGNYSGSVSSFARAMLLPRQFDSQGLPYQTPSEGNLFILAGVDHPLWSWQYNTINTINDRTVANVSAGFDLFKWLSFDYQFGINQYEMNRQQVINIGSSGQSGKGQITNDAYNIQEIESNFLITFKHNFGKDFTLRAVLGNNINQRTYKRHTEIGTEMVYKHIYNVNNTLGQTATQNYSQRRLWALFADAVLGYKNYAFLNLTLRNDHSSTLPKDNNSYYYPAVVGSFVFSDAFKINPEILNFGKLRIGWGSVGNDAGAYYTNGSYSTATAFNNNPMMFVSTTSYDPNLKPEYTTEVELGLELQFFDSRIGLDLALYNRNTKDQIEAISLPSSTGSSSYYTNFGKLNNKGVEIGLTLLPIRMSNSLKWEIYSTFSKNVSEVKELVEGIERITLSSGSTSEAQPTLQKGYPYGFLRGSGILRDDEGNPLVHPNTGGYLVSGDFVDLGNPNPDYKATITNTLSYKGITFGFMFDCTVGGILVSGSASDMLGRGVTQDTEDRLGTRILPGVLADPNTKQPLLDENGHKIRNTVQMNVNNMYFSPSGSTTFAMNGVHEFAAFDATVFRLSEMSLGYDLPKKWLNKTFIGSANISVVARNLWYHAPGFPEHTNFDPVSNSFGSGNVQGIERETAPTVRRVGFNLKLTF